MYTSMKKSGADLEEQSCLLRDESSGQNACGEWNISC